MSTRFISGVKKKPIKHSFYLKRMFWLTIIYGSLFLWKQWRVKCSIVTEHLSENTTSKFSLSEKSFKQRSIRFGLFMSLISWQYFVPFQVHPSFHIALGFAAYQQNSSSSCEYSPPFFCISSSITSKWWMPSFVVVDLCVASIKTTLLAESLQKKAVCWYRRDYIILFV